MGKRSSFERIDKDQYLTIDARAVAVLSMLVDPVSFCEPCAANGKLIAQLARLGFTCMMAYDIRPTRHRLKDALELTREDLAGASTIITNPPWSRALLHPMIEHFSSLAPTWLLFDADWAFTGQAEPYLRYCTDIISVGRLYWFENADGRKVRGKDNCAWYRFDRSGAPRRQGPLFHGPRQIPPELISAVSAKNEKVIRETRQKRIIANARFGALARITRAA